MSIAFTKEKKNGPLPKWKKLTNDKFEIVPYKSEGIRRNFVRS